MDHNYIICMYNDRYEIAGPFATTNEFCNWGDRWQVRNGDRPTWQSIHLDDPNAPPVVITPSKVTLTRS